MDSASADFVIICRGGNKRRRARLFVVVGKAKGFLLACYLFGIGPLRADPPPAKDDATAGWFFDQPLLADLRASPKKVFAHYFSPFPISIDNRPAESDYYTLEYLTADGEGGKHRGYGGYLRDRPMPRPRRDGADWKLRDKIEEVRLARAAGLDGFTFDILATTGSHWESLLALLQAAKQVDPGFRIVLMPDMLAEFRDFPDHLVPAIKSIAADPSLYRLPDGRLVLAPYGAHKQPPEWWTEQLAVLAREKIAIALVPVFQEWEKYAGAYAGFSYGLSDWGAANVEEIEKRKQSSERAHTLGKIWMAPVRPQDSRPKDRIFFEAHNTELLRASWESAIIHRADWVQLITWNDYSENSQIEPSPGIGSSFYDLTAYYVSWFKSDKTPAILYDALYYTYRTQPVEIDADGAGVAMTTSARKVYNEIELLGMLKSPGVLEIRIGGKSYQKSADVGLQYLRVPLAPGRPQFRLLRSGQTVLSGEGKKNIVNLTNGRDAQYISDRIE